MLPNLSPAKIFLALFFLGAIGYGLYEARAQIFGPAIELAPVASPTTQPFVELTGTSTHIVTLSMNGAPLPVTEDGAFRQEYAFAPGYNRIVFDARDAYGRSAQRVVEILYKPHDIPASPSPGSAASTSDAVASTE